MTKSTVYSSPPKYEFLIKTVEILEIESKEGKTIKTIKKLVAKNAEILEKIGGERKGGRDATYLELGLGLIRKINNNYVVVRDILNYIRQNKTNYFELCLKKLKGYQSFYYFILTYDTVFTVNQLVETTNIIEILKKQGRKLNTKSSKTWAIQGFVNLGVDHGYIEKLTNGRYRRDMGLQKTLDSLLEKEPEENLQITYKNITVGLAGTTFSLSLKRIDDIIRAQLDEFDTKYNRNERKYDININKDLDENWNIKLIKIK